MARCALLLTGLLFACGGSPPPTPAAAPASAGPAAAPPSALPNPCAANPCDARIIDPAANPCAGAAGEGKEPGGN